jgi:gliding motility-associated protein GldM
MINLMYLVLTAMLALNVSAEILNAFKTVDNSLITANSIIEDKNDQLMRSLSALEQDAKTHEKALKWKALAGQAKQASDETYNYIESLKLELKKEAGYNPPNDTTFKEDNLEASTRLFVEAPPQGKGRGKELKQKLEDLKAKLLGLDPDITKDFANSLPIDLNIPHSNNATSNKDWAAAYFHMTPTVAALTILSKFQNDVRNSEAQVIEYCNKEVGEVKVVFDQFQPIVSQSSQYLMPGQELTISGGVSASNKAVVPTVTVDGSVVPLNAQGVAETKFAVGGPGTYTKKIRIAFKKPDGTDGSVEKDIQYTVGSPTGISVSADAVKVLYVGLDNPVTISGGAKGAEAVTARIDNGSIRSAGGGKYIVNVSNPGNASISVTVDGKTTPFNFRVKNVPLPTPMVGMSAGGSVSVNAFKSNQGVRAELKDFVFEGVKYTVTNYAIICTGKGFESTGPKYTMVNGAYFNSEARQYIEMCRPGSSVIFYNIVVNGPGGSRKIDGTLAFNLTP